MRITKIIIAIALCIVSCQAICHAQSTEPLSVNLDFDARTRIAAVSGSGTRMNMMSVRASAGINPNTRFALYGTKKYRGASMQEMYIEKDAGTNRFLAGIVRLPFGIYDTRETYASGLIDYPMPRGDYYFQSVDWGVPGVQWEGGSPGLQVEAAGFDGKAAGIWDTQNTLRGGAVRLQTYVKNAIIGYSRWDGTMQPIYNVPQMTAVHMNGIDVRYTIPHLLLRGEFQDGTLSDNHTMGWYLDAYYHLPHLAKWTLTGRIEQLKPGTQYPTSHQATLGVRYVAAPQWTLVVNWRHNNAASSYQPAWSPYAGKGGDIYFQVYHEIRQ